MTSEERKILFMKEILSPFEIVNQTDESYLEGFEKFIGLFNATCPVTLGISDGIVYPIETYGLDITIREYDIDGFENLGKDEDGNCYWKYIP